jgi:hypothetical protein
MRIRRMLVCTWIDIDAVVERCNGGRQDGFRDVEIWTAFWTISDVVNRDPYTKSSSP